MTHSFRHSFRDRLREIECPSDIVDSIGEWRTPGVGHGYGNRYPLDKLGRWMEWIARQLVKLADIFLTFWSQPYDPCPSELRFQLTCIEKVLVLS